MKIKQYNHLKIVPYSNLALNKVIWEIFRIVHLIETVNLIEPLEYVVFEFPLKGSFLATTKLKFVQRF